MMCCMTFQFFLFIFPLGMKEPIMKTISALPYMLCRWPHSANVHIWSRISQTTFSTFPIHVCWEQDQSYHVKWLLLLVTVKSVFYGTVAICLALVAHRWSCLTHKFGSCCAYRSGEIFFTDISLLCLFPLAYVSTQFLHCCVSDS